MSLILVLSPNANCRRLYVDNLVRRGYVTVGVANAGDAENLLRAATPDLTLICCLPAGYEPVVEQLRTTYGLTGSLVLISQDKADPVWAHRWDVDVCFADPMDLRRLIEILRPWLPAMRETRSPSATG